MEYSFIPTQAQADVRRRVLTDCLQASARLYMFFARATLNQLDAEGETAVRKSIRNYGAWRGSEMKQAHTALGEDLNVETLLKRWDSASTYVAKDEVEDAGSYAPHDVSFNVSYCPASLAWKEADFHRWGHVYCDEFHQAAATAYHRDALVVIPINMMKGDHQCEFRWVMPNLDGRTKDGPSTLEPVTQLGRKLAPLYEQTSDEEKGMRLALIRTNRLLAGRYMTFMQALEEFHGRDTTFDIARKALAAWASDRGGRLRNRLMRGDRSTEISANTIWQETDLAPKFTWVATLKHNHATHLHAVIDANPLDDMWKDYEASDYAHLFWSTTLPPYFEELFPHTSPNIRLEGGALREISVSI